MGPEDTDNEEPTVPKFVSSEPIAPPSNCISRIIMSSSTTPSIDKLTGRDNYSTWKFAMQAYLEHEDLWECIVGTEKDAKKITKAKSKIILAVDPMNFMHIQDAQTGKDAWDKLQQAFEDSGLTRRVHLLRTLITTRLVDSVSVDDYVNKIITTAHKLNALKFNVGDEWVGTLLLAGLPADQYKPMIMGLESSGVPITGDSIKTKLLQEISNKGSATETETALLMKPWN